jgi:hypothetical protein
VRRDELEALGIRTLPVMATVALGALPGPPEWAPRLAAIGVDVLASGAAVDTPDTWTAAQAAVPYRPVKAMAGDAGALVAAGARIVEGAGGPVAGAYRLGADDAMVVVVDGASAEVEDPNVVAREVVEAALSTPPARLWVASSPGLDRLPDEVAEAKLRALAECAYRARLVFTKEQTTPD